MFLAIAAVAMADRSGQELSTPDNLSLPKFDSVARHSAISSGVGESTRRYGFPAAVSFLVASEMHFTMMVIDVVCTLALVTRGSDVWGYGTL